MSARKPSPQQQRVIDWALNGAGSANIVARAGSGKTSLLMMTIDALWKAGRSNIFLGAFNKKIAGELEQRLAEMRVPRHVATASTLHSAGLRAWSAVCPKRPQVSQWKMHDVVDAMLAEKIISAADHESYKGFIVKAAQYAKLSGVGVLWHLYDIEKWNDLFDHYGMLDDVQPAEGETYEQLVVRLVEMTSSALLRSVRLARTVIDFDDMLWMPVYENVKFQQYDFVFIDEAQDTNEIRRELAMRMLKPGGRCIAVGDDRQAIYGFTGANADSMDLIKQQLNSVEFPLTVSYRCGKAIIAEARRVVDDIEAWDAAPEGAVDVVNENDWNLFDLTERDAVLCRVNAPLVSLAYACIRNGIPARIEGRDIAAGLIAITKRWKTVSLAAFEDQLGKWFNREIKKFVDDAGEALPRCAAKAAALEDKYQTLLALAEATRSEYGAGAKVEDMRKMIAGMFGDSEARDAKPMLTFCSVHKAKGLEWPRVCIYGADKFMPHPMARADWERGQEENLLYVAITRAQQRLTWVNVGGKPAERRAK